MCACEDGKTCARCLQDEERYTREDEPDRRDDYPPTGEVESGA